MANVEIYTPESCYDRMYLDYQKGKVKGTTTYDKELDSYWTWRLQEFNIWTGYANEGKLLSIDTWIPTIDGWKKMIDVKVGDKVFDENGHICNVTNVSEINTTEKCYRIDFLGGESVVCGENHQWVVDNEQSRASKVRQSKKGKLKKRGSDQTHKCLKSFITTCKQMVIDFKKNNRNNYSIDLCKKVNYFKKNLLIDPYILGCWLGDGTSSSQGITGLDDEIFQNIKDRGYVVKDGSVEKTKFVQNLAKKLKVLNLLNNKHIPVDYLQSSIEDRLELLKGLMDTDGTIDKLGRCTFNNCNKQLADDVYELMCSLGIKVYYTNRPAKLYGKITGTNYELKFKCDFSVFHLSRKKMREIFKTKNKCRLINNIVEVDQVPLKCIEVDSPNHMYLCTKSYIPTHNSLFLKQICLIKALEEGRKFIFCSPEDYPPEEFFDDMIHTITGGSTDKDRDNYIDPRLYNKAFDLIKDKFLFLYIKPPFNTIENVLKQMQELIDTHSGIYGCIIDPILKFTPSEKAPERDDKYAGYIGTLLVDFARRNNISLHLIMHQNTPKPLEGTGLYPKPNMYNVKGGGSWNDGADNLLFIQRPEYAKDKIDDKVIFGSQKIKKQKLVGVPGEMKLRFNRKTNRYIKSDNSDLFDFTKFLI